MGAFLWMQLTPRPETLAVIRTTKHFNEQSVAIF